VCTVGYKFGFTAGSSVTWDRENPPLFGCGGVCQGGIVCSSSIRSPTAAVALYGFSLATSFAPTWLCPFTLCGHCTGVTEVGVVREQHAEERRFDIDVVNLRNSRSILFSVLAAYICESIKRTAGIAAYLLL
jgi:hypothetical protein